MTTGPTRLTLVIASLGSGGAERILSVLANSWAADGHAVTVVTLFNRATDFYTLADPVTRVALDLAEPASSIWSGVWNNARRVVHLRRCILGSRPDVVLSFGDQTNVLTLAATAGTRLRVVVAERNNPELDTPRLWRLPRRLLYPRASSLVVQTEGVARWARKLVPADRVRVIPNFAAIAPRPALHAGSRAHRIAALGRLTPQKGFDLLIHAFASLGSRFTDWQLVIGGEGPSRRELEELRDRLGLRGRVHFPGRVSDAAAFLSEAAVFALSSRYEGFPNVLVEAMASGAACVSFDCDFGPRDIVRTGLDGLLVSPGNVEALRDGLCRLLASSEMRENYGREARRIPERLGFDAIRRTWADVVLCRDGSRERELCS